MKFINKSNSECYDISKDINFPPGEVIETEFTGFIRRKIKEGILGEVDEELLHEDEEIDLSKLTVAELKQLAAERKIDIDSDDRKQEIINKIKAGA